MLNILIKLKEKQQIQRNSVSKANFNIECLPWICDAYFLIWTKTWRESKAFREKADYVIP